MPIIVSAGHISLPADGDESTRTDEGEAQQCGAPKIYFEHALRERLLAVVVPE